MALTIEFLTSGTSTSHARIGKLAESYIGNRNRKTRDGFERFERVASVSLMQDEELAKEVRLHPTLYDKSDKGEERIFNFLELGTFNKIY